MEKQRGMEKISNREVYLLKYAKNVYVKIDICVA